MKITSLLLIALLSMLLMACFPEEEMPTPDPTPMACNECDGVVYPVVFDSDRGVAIKQLANKKVLVGIDGYDSTASDFYFVLMQYHENGSLDTSFGNQGIVSAPLSPGYEKMEAIEIQPDGKIVVAGYGTTGAGSDWEFIVARYNTDGSVDTTFNGAGWVSTDIGTGYDLANTINIQDDGKILVGGKQGGSPDNFAMVRYNSDGSLDTGFGANGIVIFPGGFQDHFLSIDVQGDGKIVAAGWGDTSSNGTGLRFTVFRLNANGTLDTSFNSTGKVMTHLGTSNNSKSTGLFIQSDGKYVVTGDCYGSNSDFCAVRYNTDGTLDTSFGVSGEVITDIEGVSNETVNMHGYNNDHFIIAGHSSRTKLDITLVKYLADGSVDTSFVGNSGVGNGTFVESFNSLDITVNGLDLQHDNKILVIGTYYDVDRYKFMFVRLNADGTLDDAFFGQD